jgi:3-hydroxybutyryl-CoA dehydrogenase
MSLTINTLGIVGAGQMGSGIAHVCAAAGIAVRLNDVNEERINGALATINGNMARQVAKGSMDEAARQTALGRITGPRASTIWLAAIW